MGGVSPDIMDPRPENLKPGVSTNETRGGGTWRPALWKIKQEACSVGCHGFLCLKGSEGRNLSHSHSPPPFFLNHKSLQKFAAFKLGLWSTVRNTLCIIVCISEIVITLTLCTL